jgi:predicted regulator of Ras-like GTPase activity (Roadblock/LC7/MglB family)
MNVFREALRGIAERVEGARAAALVGADGIAVESFSIGESVSMETVAAEVLALAKAAQGGDALTGALSELALVEEDARILLRRVSGEYYLLLLLGGEGGLGRGRHELAKAALALKKELC